MARGLTSRMHSQLMIDTANCEPYTASRIRGASQITDHVPAISPDLWAASTTVVNSATQTANMPPRNRLNRYRAHTRRTVNGTQRPADLERPTATGSGHRPLNPREN